MAKARDRRPPTPPRLSQPGQLLFAGFEGTSLPADLARLVEAGRLGGVVLFSRNLGDPEQVRGLVAELHARAPDGAPLTVAIDQEGGRVQRLRAPWTEWPPMRRLGGREPEATGALAAALARELADLGIDLDFAPVVDVDSNPANPVIGDRSFSSAPERVAEHAVAFIEALQAGGVAACAKHFPGHGDTSVDSHLELPRLDCDLERLRAIELLPFRAAADCGVASVMTAHILFPRLDPRAPATLSPEVLRCLRVELGYEGLVFSDDVDMAALADHYTPEQMVDGALAAGVDALLACRRPDLRDAVLARLESAPTARLAAALARMAAFKARYAGGRARRSGAPGPPYPDHETLALRLR